MAKKHDLSSSQKTRKPVEAEKEGETTANIPYHEICRRRYTNAEKIYDEQFLYELRHLEAIQSSAYSAMRFHRHFVITTLWPPLHTRKEIEMVSKHMSLYKLSDKQEKRLRNILTN